jgi:hypothetical protein
MSAWLDSKNRTLEAIDYTPQLQNATASISYENRGKLLHHLSMASGEALVLTLPRIAEAIIGIPYMFVCTVDGGGGATFTVQDNDDAVHSGQDIALVFKDVGDNATILCNGQCWSVLSSDLTA